MADFIAYAEKTIINRILTSWFRHTGFIHPQMKLDLKEIKETDGGHLRIEGDLLDDFYEGEDGRT